MCCYPGCNYPAELSDNDHAIPFDEGGTTDRVNCGLLCRRHHRLKTVGGWRLERHADGSLSWISATGHRYDTPGPVQQAAV